MSELEEALRRSLKRPTSRRPVVVTQQMAATWARLKALEPYCRCEHGGRLCATCIESHALEESLRDKFQLEDWQEVASPDDGAGHREAKAAHARYLMLEATLRASRRAEKATTPTAGERSKG
jgi:hypothetical protein